MVAAVAAFFFDSESEFCTLFRVTGFLPAMMSAMLSLYICILRTSCSNESSRMMFSISIVRDLLPG